MSNQDRNNTIKQHFENYLKNLNIEKTINVPPNIINKCKNKYAKEYINNPNIINEYNNVVNRTKKSMDYEYLVFSGGSVKAEAYCGMLDVLEDKGILYDLDKKSKIKGYAGTSAGSIFASLLAVGFSPNEIKDIMVTLDFGKIIYNNFIVNAYNFLRYYGLSDGKKLRILLENLIEKKTFDKKYTIQQLYNDRSIKLCIVATNINTGNAEYFYPNHKNDKFSNISIVDAILMSVSIPFIFEPVLFNNNYYVDGGLVDNYPINAFDNDNPDDDLVLLNIMFPNSKVLGAKISSDNGNLFDNNNKNLCNYSVNFIDILLKKIDSQIMTSWNILRTIDIYVPNIDITTFSLTNEQHKELINAGKNATINFFS
jgi:NTE family protein